MSDRIELPDYLRALLEVMSNDMGVPVESLVNQAIFTLARVNGYVVPSPLPEPTRVQNEGDEQESPEEADAADPSDSRLSADLSEGVADLEDAPAEPGPLDEVPENTIVRRSNQAVRIRAISEDVAALTTPFSRVNGSVAEVAPHSDDDEWSSDDEDEEENIWDSEAPESDSDGEWGDDPSEPVGSVTPEIAEPDRSEEPEDAAEDEPLSASADPEEVVEAPPSPEPAAVAPISLSDEDGEPTSYDPRPAALENDLSAIDDELAALDDAPAASDEDDEREIASERASTKPVVAEPEPAWVDTESPETALAPEPVLGDPTEVERQRNVGPLLGSQRASEGDYDQLFADLEDLETGARIPFDDDEEESAGQTDIVESR
ncbi:MAG: hypothetical protein AAF658_08990, partial [Myxococcota bacterium]